MLRIECQRCLVVHHGFIIATEVFQYPAQRHFGIGVIRLQPDCILVGIQCGCETTQASIGIPQVVMRPGVIRIAFDRSAVSR